MRLTAPLLTFVCLSSCDCEVEPLNAVPGRVAGILCDALTGAPAPALAISVVPAAGAALRSETDEAGSFLVDGVPAGPATLVVGDREIELLVSSDGTTTVDDPACRDVPPGPGFGDIIGTVCNRHTGALVQAATVTVPLDSGNLETTTDADGHFQLWSVPSGARAVIVSGDGFQRTWLVEVIGGAVVEIPSEGACRSATAEEGMLSGTFCDPLASEGGAPLTGARVAITDVAGELHTELTDVEGAFLAGPLPPGLARVRITRGSLLIERTAVIVAGAEAQLSNGGACIVEQCTESQLQSDGRTELIFVVDRSGSMNFGAPGYDGTRWEGVVGAIEGVSSQLDARIAFGLALYPSLESNECGTTGPYVVPAFDNGPAVAARLSDFDSEPAGATPTAAALESVRAWHLANPTDRKRAVLLATDGAPNCNSSLNPATCVCSSGDNRCATSGEAYQCLDDDAAVAAVDALHALGVDAYIIGVPGVESFGYVLDRMAEAGGSVRHYVARDVDTLEAAVVDIARRAGGCTVRVSEDLSTIARLDIAIDGAPIAYDPLHDDGYEIVDAHHVELYGEACEAYLTAGSAAFGTCVLQGSAP